MMQMMDSSMMMTSCMLGGMPTVNYFDLGCKGRAELVRMFFHYCGVPFVDNRIMMKDWVT
jgi:hypothetical protein